LWYGKYSRIDFKSRVKRSKLNLNKTTVKTTITSFKKIKMTSLKKIHCLPSAWNRVLVRSKIKRNDYILYLFNDYYFFKIFALNSYLKLYVDSVSNTLVVRNLFEPSYTSFFFKLFKKNLKSFSYWFYTRLKIRGKGYYVYKTFRNTITHQVGHSHRRYIYAYFVFTKFLSKTVVYIAGNSKTDILHVGRTIQNSKYINIFTGRGVRFSRQVIYKKTGKVSAYR
jgi:ribosomal protein L6P/L9E